MGEYVAAFVVASGEIEASAAGERVTHAELAARLGLRLGVDLGGYVSGVVTRDEHGGLIRVGGPREAGSRREIESVVRTRFGDLGPLEVVFSA